MHLLISRYSVAYVSEVIYPSNHNSRNIIDPMTSSTVEPSGQPGSHKVQVTWNCGSTLSGAEVQEVQQAED